MRGEFQSFPELFSSAKEKVLMEVALRREEVDHKIKHRHCTGFKIGISEATGGGAWGLQTLFFFGNHEVDVLLHYIFLCVYNLYNCKVPSKNRFLLPGFFGSDFPPNPPFAHQQDKLRYLTRFLEKIQESTHAAAVRTPGVASGVKNGFPGLDNVCTSKVLTKPQRKRI